MARQGNRKDPVERLKDRILAGKVRGLSPELYFKLQAETIAIARHEPWRENEELREQIEDLRRVNVDLDVATGHLEECLSKALVDLKGANRQLHDLKGLVVALLMPWARFMGDLALKSFVQKLVGALGFNFGRTHHGAHEEVIAELYSEKSRFLNLRLSGSDEISSEATSPLALENSLEQFREHYKKFMT